MDPGDFLARAGRDVAASMPPPTAEEMQELILRLQQIAAREAARKPEAIARREAERRLRHEMHRACERYLSGEIRLYSLIHHLRTLEDRLREWRGTSAQ